MAALNGICHRARGAQTISVTIAFAVAMACHLQAQATQPTEYQVKAAYLANFPKFVEWPESNAKSEPKNESKTDSKTEPFNICVLGRDPFGPALDSAVAGEAVDSNPIATKRISRPQEALNCRVLFISSSEDGQWKEILAAVKTSSVLTVSDMREFARRGGIVQFIWDGNKVRFQINLAAAEPPGLKLSSELLKLAVAVKNNP